MKDKIRVRFAPSPTGALHIGGVRTALYNYLFAKKNKGTFILRIEDTDQTRYVEGAENYIVEALKWCHLVPDEGACFGGEYGPYHQSKRKNIYRQYAEKMVSEGYAYYAFDTPVELEELRKRQKAAKSSHRQYDAVMRMEMKNSLTLSEDEVQQKINAKEPYVIRIKIIENEEVFFEDIIKGKVVVNTNNMDDKVLFKSDGMPTYHFANVVDDYLMKITHVIRGEEWLPSAPLHVLLYQYLGWEKQMPHFAHLPLILKPDGNGKLSKRDGERLGFPIFPLDWVSPETGEKSSGYREKGYFPDAFINMLAFLGWNPGTEKELFTLDELVNEFSLERVAKAGAKFDSDKAKWYNQQYLKEKSDEELAALFNPHLIKEGIDVPAEYIAKVCNLLKERVTFVEEMLKSKYFFAPPEIYDEKMLRKKWKDNTHDIIKELKGILQNITDFSAENTENEVKTFIENKGLGFGAVMPNLRLLITGKSGGPSLFEIMTLIGQKETIERIERGLKLLNMFRIIHRNF